VNIEAVRRVALNTLLLDFSEHVKIDFSQSWSFFILYMYPLTDDLVGGTIMIEYTKPWFSIINLFFHLGRYYG
jgi:hypothetical protein